MASRCTSRAELAEVVQYTTAESRFWAYLGAIPHWLYFTPLRKHQPEWFKFVVWSSGIATVAALLGIIIALWMLSLAKQYRYDGAPTSIPYRGWKRWHMILGLFFGVTAVTFALSRLLSMGPFEFVERLVGNAPSNPQAKRGAAAAATLSILARPYVVDVSGFPPTPPNRQPRLSHRSAIPLRRRNWSSPCSRESPFISQPTETGRAASSP
jgi:hypothetical protein